MCQARCGENAAVFQLICSEDCAARAEDLWDVLKDKYAVLIGGGKTVRDSWRVMTNSNVTNLRALSTTHFPANSYVEQIRRRVFLATNQHHWGKMPKEDSHAGDAQIKDMHDMIVDMKSELANVGYAPRRHNVRHVDRPQN